MAGFQAPVYSSSPPATPDKKAHNPFTFGGTAPSTTPAGPPPSSAGSYTPAGPPPSSVFGSSILGNTNAIKPLSFSKQSVFEPSKLQFDSPNSSTASFLPPGRSALGNEYQSSPQRGFHAPEPESEDEEYDQEGEEYEEEENVHPEARGYAYDDADAMTDDDAQYDENDMEMGDYSSNIQRSRRASPDQRSDTELDLPAPDDLRDSRLEIFRASASSTKPKFDYAEIAREFFASLGLPDVTESDGLILETEAIVAQLYDEDEDQVGDEDKIQRALSEVPSELTRLWAAYQENTAVIDSEEYTAAIGPGSRAPKFAKANFLAGLALQMYHPHVDYSDTFQPRIKPLPEALLEWLDECHNPYPSQFEEVQLHRPSSANHYLFWDVALSTLLRGKVEAVINLLKTAGWKNARADLDGTYTEAAHEGYSGVALANVERVIGAAIQVLLLCPAVQGDWNVRSSEWALFRLRVSQALEDLKSFAEGRDSVSNESIMSNVSKHNTYSQTARKAESRVPWHIYQRLVNMYNLLMGEATDIMGSAGDWCEATIGLLVWWDDGKHDRRIGLSQLHGRSSDTETYLKKLQKSFKSATKETDEFQVNTLDPIQVGLASLLEGDAEAVIGFLRAWSGPVSSAVAEVASIAGWLPHPKPGDLIDMDQDDMDVLNAYNSSPSKSDGIKDQTLVIYARALSTVERFEERGITQAGWEVAISILGRLDSAARSEDMISELLQKVSLDSSATVDKLWILLNNIGMTGLAETTAESYANTLAEDTHKYGEALWYYALAHRTQKVKDVLDLLISLSLVQSTAYPPEPELDDYLRRLVSTPNSALTEMSKMDNEAAELLHKTLSGYATLRNFYDLRDGELTPKTQGSLSRKQDAVSALLAVISSADDNIRGGLYDETRGAVVNVDFILALLGEAMVFVNQPASLISVSQIDTLLKAIEDIQTVGPRVYSACSEFLPTVIASAQGLKGSTPSDMLRKSMSNVSGTSSFSMVGSSMLASQLKQSMSSSGVLVKGNIKRGWDWRRGIVANMTAEDLLRILRLGLAKDLAKAWLVEADNKM